MTETKILDPGLSGYIELTPDIVTSDYMAEIRELAFASSQPGFDSCLARFQNYPVHLRQIRKKLSNPYKTILDASNGTRIIDTSTQSPIIWDALLTAHIAACCNLFQGSNLKYDQLNSQSLFEMGQEFIARYKNASQQDLRLIMDKLHYMDTVRTMHQLRLLGLITRKTSSFRQLALGAGPGIKDMYALHQMPCISLESIAGEDHYKFHTIQEYVEHIIITDLDERRQDLYQKYNQQVQPKTYAVCSDMADLLQELPNQNYKKCNLVTAIRIDHRMLPDVSGFLKLLSKNIDESCTLVMSMGAGNTAEEFEGRVNKLAEIFNLLETAGMQPVLLKLHGPGTLTEQHQTLRFGNPSASTFQALYCELRKKQLKKID